MLVGLMPSGNEATTSYINNYLGLIVEELLELYEGIQIKMPLYLNCNNVCTVLLMVNADIPVCRKVAGFLGHVSGFACNFCSCKFNLVEGKVNCTGGYDSFESWNLRNNQSNCAAASKWLKEKNPLGRKTVENETGTRYAALHKLHYFDLVKQCPPDPMYCLLLGTGIRMIKEWENLGLLSNDDLKRMQRLADTVELPCGFENVKGKIVLGLSGMKADAAKSWIWIYSPLVLIGMSTNIG